MWLFFLLSIINIPLLTFYYQVNTKGGSQMSLFTRFALANTASDQFCSTYTYGKNNNLLLECPRNQSTIDALKFIGIAKNDTASCRGAIAALRPEKVFTQECFFDFDVHTPKETMSPTELKKVGHKYMQDSKDVAPFKNWFVGNCVGKAECRIPLDAMRLRPGCMQVLEKRKGTKPKEASTDDAGPSDQEVAQAGWIDAGRRMLKSTK